MKHIGLFGGTFNPIHIGHLQTALEVLEEFRLDKICFIPSALPPHKELKGVADAEDRLEMTQLAVENCPYFMVSDVELKRSGPSYTVDTIYDLKAALPDTQLCFIVGLDAFLEIDTWKSYKKIFQEVPVIVMARPGSRGTAPTYLRMSWRILEDFLQTRISAGYQFSASQNCYVHPEKQPVYIFNVTLLDISATKIRERVKNNKSIQFLVPEKVEYFIKTKGLFQ